MKTKNEDPKKVKRLVVWQCSASKILRQNSVMTSGCLCTSVFLNIYNTGRICGRVHAGMQNCRHAELQALQTCRHCVAEIKDPGMVGHFKCGETWPWHGWPRQMLKLMILAWLRGNVILAGFAMSNAEIK